MVIGLHVLLYGTRRHVRSVDDIIFAAQSEHYIYQVSAKIPVLGRKYFKLEV